MALLQCHLYVAEHDNNELLRKRWEHKRLWIRGDKKVKDYEQQVSVAQAETKAAQDCAERLAQENMALNGRLTAKPPVAFATDGFACGPMFAHGLRYGFHGAGDMRAQARVNKVENELHKTAIELKKVTRERDSNAEELKRWRRDFIMEGINQREAAEAEHAHKLDLAAHAKRKGLKSQATAREAWCRSRKAQWVAIAERKKALAEQEEAAAQWNRLSATCESLRDVLHS